MESLTGKEKILEKFVDAIKNKVEYLKNLDTINGLIGAIPILEEVLDIHEDLFEMIVIQKGSTNGDVVKALFQDEGTPELALGNIVCYGDANYDKDWWNAPYERGEKL